MHEVLVNRLEGLSLPRKSVVRLTDRPDMTLDVYRGRKTTIQQQQYKFSCKFSSIVRARHIVDRLKKNICDTSVNKYVGFLALMTVTNEMERNLYFGRLQSNFNGSNTFGTMQISSRQG